MNKYMQIIIKKNQTKYSIKIVKKLFDFEQISSTIKLIGKIPKMKTKKTTKHIVNKSNNIACIAMALNTKYQILYTKYYIPNTKYDKLILIYKSCVLGGLSPPKFARLNI